MNHPIRTQHKLVIADGTGIIRRVYEATKGDDSPERVAGALESSWFSILRALREHEPTHFLLAVDHGGETWRHRLSADYKVNRSPMSPFLKSAIPGFLARLHEGGLKSIIVPDVEADDVMTTIALKAVSRGFEVVVLTSDKDMLKLLDSGVQIYDHFQSMFRDEAWVRERYHGIPPSLMTDFLALWGDETDGIPGVKHVGDKTAAKLLHQFGSLDGVLAGSADIKGKLGQSIRDSIEVARLSYALATLKKDVETGITPRDIELSPALIAYGQSAPEPKLIRTSVPAHQAVPGKFQGDRDAAASQPRRMRM